MRRRWVLEIKLDGVWYEKRFFTRAGAGVYIALIKWSADRFTIWLDKEPRRS